MAGYLVDTFQIALSIADRFVDCYIHPIDRHRYHHQYEFEGSESSVVNLIYIYIFSSLCLTRFVLVAAAAFLISSKKHETSTPRLTDIAKYLSNVVTAEDIKVNARRLRKGDEGDVNSFILM